MVVPTLPILSKTILLVENDTPECDRLTRLLEIEGYIVHPAQQAQEALTVLGHFSPDLILSAADLPEASGVDFYHRVRENSRWTSIPFIFMISENGAGGTQKARELGVEDFLPKPVDGDVLVKVISARLLRAAELQVALIDEAYLETVNVLANTIEGRDPYTHGHVERVATYTRWLAEALHWPSEQLRRLEFGARLHDIGKIVVPDHILKKPGPLSDEEWALMKQHTVAGAKILRNIRHLQDAVPYVLNHHERWDGGGYPYGLKGREIPMEGRLLALADVYDALTTARPYHPARPQSEVVKFLRMRAGTQFDPDLVEIFIQVLEKRSDNTLPLHF